MKPDIAILGGGRTQRGLALRSARFIADSLRERGHRAWLVHVEEDEWYVEDEGRRVPVNRHDFSMQVGGERIRFGFAFNAVHDDMGKGALQGYLELMGVPYDGSGQLASLLADDKSATKAVLVASGLPMAKGVLYRKEEPLSEGDILERVGLPCFVKPNRGGSAIGSNKVSRAEELGAALEEALRWDEAVLVESFIPGREVTSGVVALGGELVALPLTEYLLDGGCRTWELNQGSVPKQTPALLPEAVVARCQELSRRAYRALGCRGLVRIDYRLDGEALYLLEVNTLPGLERVGAMCQQLLAAGFDLGEVFETLMREEFEGVRESGAARPRGRAG
ncbi:MAG TPA: ATP-grasp domain-containing protein [Myxococcaceae bacterium]|nr:ATP-grasp domain-containing protein [Myxococcaceae bacterium]